MIPTTNLDIVAGSAIPVFLAFKDYFPDPASADWTDFSTADDIFAVCRQGADGTAVEVNCTKKSYTIGGEAIAGVEIAEADTAATFDIPSNNWQIQVWANLSGSPTEYAKSKIITVRVVPAIDRPSSSS